MSPKEISLFQLPGLGERSPSLSDTPKDVMFTSVFPEQERGELGCLVLRHFQDDWTSTFPGIGVQWPHHSTNLTLCQVQQCPCYRYREPQWRWNHSFNFRCGHITLLECCNGPKVLTFIYQNLKVSNLNNQCFCHTHIHSHCSLYKICLCVRI